MELEEPINANDEKDVSDESDVEVIRRVLDEMIERYFLCSLLSEIFKKSF